MRKKGYFGQSNSLTARQAAMRLRMAEMDALEHRKPSMCPLCYKVHTLPDGVPVKCWQDAFRSKGELIKKDFAEYLTRNKLGRWE